MGELKVNQLHALTKNDLTRLTTTSQNGRKLLINDQYKFDFVSTNYLGLDFHPLLVQRGMEYFSKWGSLSGWSRLEVDPVIYSDLETQIASFIGCKDVILSHTITITNFSIISAIAKKGFIFCDHKVHTVVWEACRLARDHGAKLVKFNHLDVTDLEKKIKEVDRNEVKLICVDGVDSISALFSPILDLQRLCEEYNAWLYVDDAHGFGVLGKSPNNDYGKDGSGVVNYFGGNYDRTFYVSSFGKSFSVQSAFITIPTHYPHSLREECLQYIYSAPMPPFVVGGISATLEINQEQGEVLRRRLMANTKRLLEGLKQLGLKVYANQYFPIIFWEIGTVEQLIQTATEVFNNGVLAGLRAYPVVPNDKCGLRFGVTALHTEEEIQESLNIIEKVLKNKK